jgi:hypothetical protein
MSKNISRDLTPADARFLEPDLLGLLAFVLHGHDQPSTPRPELNRPPANWRGLKRRRG